MFGFAASSIDTSAASRFESFSDDFSGLTVCTKLKHLTLSLTSGKRDAKQKRNATHPNDGSTVLKVP